MKYTKFIFLSLSLVLFAFSSVAKAADLETAPIPVPEETVQVPEKIIEVPEVTDQIPGETTLQLAAADCSAVTLGETGTYVGAPEANFKVSVTADETCPWSAVSDSPWLLVLSTTPDPAVGSGSFRVRSLDNMGPHRFGHITVGSAVYTVEQEAGPFCPVNRSALIVNGARGSGSSFVTNADRTQTTATFMLKEGCVDKTITLLSWKKESSTVKFPQTLLDSKSAVFTGDGLEHSLTISLPPCQLQVDLVFGTFTDTILTAVNDAVLGQQVADWIVDNTACTTLPAPKGTITVTKVVVNDDSGTAQVSDYVLSVGTTKVTSGVAGIFDPGTYLISESGPAGYNASFSGDCDGAGNITIAANENKVCTITNNDIGDTGGGEQTVSTSGGGSRGGLTSSARIEVPAQAPASVLGETAPVLPAETFLDVGGGEDFLPRTGASPIMVLLSMFLVAATVFGLLLRKKTSLA